MSESQEIMNAIGQVVAFTGMRLETSDAVLFMNDWESRDAEARARGTYDHGRWSFPGLVHGRWYCCR